MVRSKFCSFLFAVAICLSPMAVRAQSAQAAQAAPATTRCVDEALSPSTMWPRALTDMRRDARPERGITARHSVPVCRQIDLNRTRLAPMRTISEIRQERREMRAGRPASAGM